MAVRLASDTIRTLYAIQCMKKDVQHRPQFPVYQDNKAEIRKKEKSKKMSKSTDSVDSDPSDMPKQEQQYATSTNALVHKVSPKDRPISNNVKLRAECDELDDILTKWNVYRPKK